MITQAVIPHSGQAYRVKDSCIILALLNHKQLGNLGSRTEGDELGNGDVFGRGLWLALPFLGRGVQQTGSLQSHTAMESVLSCRRHNMATT